MSLNGLSVWLAMIDQTSRVSHSTTTFCYEQLCATGGRRHPASGVAPNGMLGEGEVAALAPLSGGVSSDIYLAQLPMGPVCIKRALPKLKVTADWRAQVERNHWEVEWMRTADALVPGSVPKHPPSSQ